MSSAAEVLIEKHRDGRTVRVIRCRSRYCLVSCAAEDEPAILWSGESLEECLRQFRALNRSGRSNP